MQHANGQAGRVDGVWVEWGCETLGQSLRHTQLVKHRGLWNESVKSQLAVLPKSGVNQAEFLPLRLYLY